MRHTVLAIALGLCLVACGGKGSGGAAGTYGIDMDAMKPQIDKMMGGALEAAEKMLESMPEDQRAEMKKQIDMQRQEAMKNFDMTLTMNGDGTFAVTQGEKSLAKGTWTLNGSVLSVTTTEEEGKKKDNPETLTGTYADGTLRFKPDKDMPFDLVFKKK